MKLQRKCLNVHPVHRLIENICDANRVGIYEDQRLGKTRAKTKFVQILAGRFGVRKFKKKPSPTASRCTQEVSGSKRPLPSLW